MESLHIETYERMKAREVVEENVSFAVLQSLCSAIASYCANNVYLRRNAREWSVAALEKELDTVGIFKPQASPRRKQQAISAADRIAVFERDAYRCVLCGDWHELTIDHKIPLAKGGSDCMDNLQTMCRSCNCGKGATL